MKNLTASSFEIAAKPPLFAMTALLVVGKRKQETNDQLTRNHPRRPHSRHRRRRRNRRSSEGDRRRARASGVAGIGHSSTPKRTAARHCWRDPVARHRQFPELALPRSGRGNSPIVSASSRRMPITARSAAKARSAICTKPRNASRAANAASLRSAAPKRSAPRPRPNAPASRCRGRRSHMTSPNQNAAPRSRSRWR